MHSRLEEELEENRPRRVQARRGLREEHFHRFRVRLANPQYVSALRSGRPQCILKVTSHASGSRVRNVLEYITRQDRPGEPLPFETNHGLQSGHEALQELYEEWAQDFERKKPGSKREPRHVTHIVLSAKTPNTPHAAVRVNAAARDFLEKNFGDAGYEYAFVTHHDTDHPHVHVVVKNYNRELDRKLHLSKAATFDLRTEWAASLQERGIEANATLRRDRETVLDGIAQGADRVAERNNWNDTRMRNAPGLTIEQRKALTRQVIRMKNQVREVTLPFSAERRQHMAALRDLTAAIRERDAADVRQTARASLITVGRSLTDLRNDLVSLASDPAALAGSARAPAKVDQLQRRRRLEKQIRSIGRDIRLAAGALKQSDLPPDERRLVLENLKAHKRRHEQLAALLRKPSRLAQLKARRKRDSLERSR